MPIPKSKRKESQFEVFHHWTEVRKKITDLLLMDFGYSFEKFYKKLERRYGGKSFEELIEKIHFLLKSCYKIQTSNIAI